jgi:hypothetical protein
MSTNVSEEHATTIFRVEVGSEMFLWNAGWLSVDCMALYPRR